MEGRVCRLFLIRHGRSEMNAQRRAQGWLDSPLDETGRAQAQAVARRLREEAPQVIYTSPLSRARETAEIIAQTLNVPLAVDDRLKERGLGAISGLTRQEIEAQFPEWVQQWLKNPERISPPGGERPEAFWKRVVEVFEEIAARHPGEVIGVVSHAGVIGTYLTHLTGAECCVRSPFVLANGSLSIVELGGHRARIRLVNECCHLAGVTPLRTKRVRLKSDQYSSRPART